MDDIYNNMAIIDLHTHSTVSDGTMKPAEIFALAHELHLQAVALTDHDTVDGLAEFMAAGAEYPECEAVPGVELACSFMNREIHIVGLFIDRNNPVLLEFIENARIERCRRNRDIFVKLELKGYPLDMSMPEFDGYTLDSIGRPHFARALVNRFGFANIRQVFDKLLGHNRPAYVPRKLPDPRLAIDAIHASGGVAVWAHPVQRERNERAWLTRAARKLAALGLDAVEGYYSMFGQAESAMVCETAPRYSLAISGGSDFHGENSPDVVLGFGAGGLRVPAELLAGLKAKRIERLRELSPEQASADIPAKHNAVLQQDC